MMDMSDEAMRSRRNIRQGPCGQHTPVPVMKPILGKQRVKFGLLWLIFTLFTGGFGFLLWLIMPRRTVVVGEQTKGFECVTCGVAL